MDCEDTNDIDASKTEKKTRQAKLTPLEGLYTSSDFSDWKTPLIEQSDITPLKIETVMFDEKLAPDATAEQVAAYDEATASVKAFIWYRKKKIYVPTFALARHRKKPRAGKDFKNKTYFELSHAQAAELRKALTHMKNGASLDTKYDWILDELAPGCVWVLEVPVNLNEGYKIQDEETDEYKAVNAPEEWRYFPRVFIGRLMATDDPGDNDQAFEAGELLPVPPTVQLKWLTGDNIERGASIDKIFEKEKFEETFNVPIKLDVKAWTDAAKEKEGKKPRATSGTKDTNGTKNANDDDKKDKTTTKRKADGKSVTKTVDPKPTKTPDVKIPESKASVAKRAKTDSTSTVPPADKTAVALMLEEARKTGGTLVMTSYRIE